MDTETLVREMLVVIMAALLSGVGASFLTARKLDRLIAELQREIQRLQQWAWGANNTNGIDGDVKEIRRSFFAYVARADRHEALQERRNYRQHPNDGMRHDDA